MRSASVRNPPADHGSEDALVRRILAGERAAFEALYERYVRPIYNLVYRMASPQEAEDITQEIFLQIHRNLGSFQFRSSLYTWIYKVACNTCLQYRKKMHRRREDTTLETVPETAIVGHAFGIPTEPEPVVERRQMLERVVGAIEGLPAQQRLVIVLGPIQGHRYEHMARMLGVSSDVIKGRLHRARHAIQRALEDRAGSAVPPPPEKKMGVSAAASH